MKRQVIPGRVVTKLRLMGLLSGFVALLAATPASGHHVIDAAYDIGKTVTLRGTVAIVAVQNPHVRVYIDVMNPDGTVARWSVETLSPHNIAARFGLDQKDLEKGFLFAWGIRSLQVFVSRTKPDEAANRRWTLSDGTVIEEGHVHKVNGILETY